MGIGLTSLAGSAATAGANNEKGEQMNRFESCSKRLIWFCLAFLLPALAGCGHWNGDSSPKAITAFSLAGATGTIDETAKNIAVTVPFGTDIKTLVATFTATGTGVKVGATAQTSGTTPNDFTSPVAYTVTAVDSTQATYTVTVAVAADFAKAITAFSLAGATGTIDETAKNIAVTVPFGTDVTALTATFTATGTGFKVGATPQTSGATANNFTSPVTYTVTAADGATVNYNVIVTVTPNSAKAITAFSFLGYPGATGIINEVASPKTIAVTKWEN
jgi:hypothetical protein